MHGVVSRNTKAVMLNTSRTVSNYMGVAVTFFAGPLLVPYHNIDDGASADTKAAVYNKEKSSLRNYLVIQTVLCAVTFVMALVHFPDKPVDAPSRSAAAGRTDFWKGIRELLAHKPFWCLALSYGVMTGIYSGWGAFLSPNLQEFFPGAEGTNTASLLGTFATAAGAVSGVGLGLVADRMKGKAKPLLITFCAIAAAAYLWFAIELASSKHTPSQNGTNSTNGTNHSSYSEFMSAGDSWDEDAAAPTAAPKKWVLYLSCILGGFVLNGTIPLFYETAVESTYPIAEGSTTCLLTTLNNIGCLIFLFLPNIHSLSDHPSWANWTLVGGCIFGLLALFPFPENYARSSFDAENDADDDEPLVGTSLQ